MHPGTIFLIWVRMSVSPMAVQLLPFGTFYIALIALHLLDSRGPLVRVSSGIRQFCKFPNGKLFQEHRAVADVSSFSKLPTDLHRFPNLYSAPEGIIWYPRLPLGFNPAADPVSPQGLRSKVGDVEPVGTGGHELRQELDAP